MAVLETRFAVLLFTDIVGSCELKHRHGVPAFQEALEIHNRSFERAARECRGVEIVQNLGDGYLAKGDSVAEAVRVALLFQDAMREGPWGAVRLVSRVGIHAGETSSIPAEGGSGLVAPALDLASRVMNLGVGGQILMTLQLFEEAQHFLREHPAVPGKTFPPLRWLAHGAYLLKGRDQPLEIFEVGVEGVAPFATPPGWAKGERLPQAAALGEPRKEPGRARSLRTRRALPSFCMGMLAMAAAFTLIFRIEETYNAQLRERVVDLKRQVAAAESAGNDPGLRAVENPKAIVSQEAATPAKDHVIPGDVSVRKLTNPVGYQRDTDMYTNAKAEPGEVISRKAGLAACRT